LYYFVGVVGFCLQFDAEHFVQLDDLANLRQVNLGLQKDYADQKLIIKGTWKFLSGSWARFEHLRVLVFVAWLFARHAGLRDEVSAAKLSLAAFRGQLVRFDDRGGFTKVDVNNQRQLDHVNVLLSVQAAHGILFRRVHCQRHSCLRPGVYCRILFDMTWICCVLSLR
jgi:hypothetical protein